MTYLDKLSKYVKHKYSIPIPPVSSEWWSVGDWINFIDQYGRWHP